VAWEVVKNNLSRKEKKLWTQNNSEEKIRVMELFDERQEAAAIVQKINESSQKFSLSEMVILYRTNAQSRALEQKLRDAGIAYVIIGGVRFYERKEIKDILAFFKVLVNPRDDLSLKRIIKAFSESVGEKSLSALEKSALSGNMSLREMISQAEPVGQLSAKARKSIEKISNWLKEFEDLKDRLPLDELAERILQRTGYLAALETEATDESLSRSENLKELVSAIREFRERTGNGSLESFLEEVALISDIDRWDNTKERVSLMTLHSAKGLEFSIVFIVGLEEGLFPLSRSLKKAVLRGMHPGQAVAFFDPCQDEKQVRADLKSKIALPG
jgi:DNA helicase-2/ATP-dependent DNA helicase PcrA